MTAAPDGQPIDDTTDVLEDQTTVRDVLDELDIDPADLDTVEDGEDVVEMDISADGEAIDPDAVALEDVDFPAGRNREACLAAIGAARDYLRENGPASQRNIVTGVMPEHPVGYDADAALEKLEAGDRYRGAWWRKVVKPGLEAAKDVEKPALGRSDWRYVGDTADE